MLRNEKGGALPLALMVMVVLSILGTALWQYFMTDTIQVARAEDRLKAYYLARSGVEVGLGVLDERLNDSVNVVHDSDDLVLNNVTSVSDIDTGTFNIQYQVDTVNDEIIITSTGTSSGVVQEEMAKVGINFPNIAQPQDWFNNGYIVQNNVHTPPEDLTNGIALLSTEVAHPLRHSSGTQTFKASIISFIDIEPSFDMQSNTIMYLMSGIVAFRDKIYLTNNSELYLKTNPGHTLEITESHYNSDENKYEVEIQFTFGSYAFTISNIEVTSELTVGTDLGIVYFGGDIKKGNGNNPPVFLPVGTEGKYYFYKENTAIHNAPTEISNTNLMEILNPEVLEEIFSLTKGLPEIEYTIWGEN